MTRISIMRHCWFAIFVVFYLISTPAQADDPNYEDDEPLETLDVTVLGEGSGQFRVTVSYDKPPPDGKNGLSLSIRSSASDTKLLLTASEDGLTFESGLLLLVAGAPPIDPDSTDKPSVLPRLDAVYAKSADAVGRLFAGSWRISQTDSDGKIVAGTGKIAADGRFASLELYAGDGITRYISDDLLAVPDSAGGKHILEIRFRSIDEAQPDGIDQSIKIIHVTGDNSKIEIETPYQSYAWDVPVGTSPDRKALRVNLSASDNNTLHGTWSNEGADGKLKGGGEQAWSKGLEIRNIFVVDKQLEQAYPFDTDGWDAKKGGPKTRRLIVHGRGLRLLVNTDDAISSSSDAIEYSLDPDPITANNPELTLVRTGTESALKSALSAKKPDASLVKALTRRKAALQDLKNLIFVDVNLASGVLPGSKQMAIEEAQGTWPLIFSDQHATLQFARYDDQLRNDPTTIFYPGDIGAIDVTFKTKMPFRTLGILLMRQTVEGKEDKNTRKDERGHVLFATRLDDLDEPGKVTFRTVPIHFLSTAEPTLAPPTNLNAFVLHVNPGDVIGASLFDSAQAFASPAVAMAKISGVSEELGELWRDALRTVAQCNKEKFDGDPRYALEKSTRFSEVAIGELFKYAFPLAYMSSKISGAEDSPFNFNPSVDAYKGDHAAAILIRDELVKLMSHRSIVVPLNALANNTAGEIKALRARALRNGPKSEPLIARYTATWVRKPFWQQPTIGKALKAMFEGSPISSSRTQMLAPVPLSETLNIQSLAKRFDATPAEAEEWAIRVTQNAAKTLLADVQIAIGRTQDAGECDIEELLVVAGQRSAPAVARIIPRLVNKISTSGPPRRDYWKADKLARGFVERLHLTGAAIRALKQYGAVDDAYKAMAVALVTAGLASGASALEFGATAAGIAIAGDALDAAYFGTKGLDKAIESQAFYDYASGASLVLGEDIFIEAEAQRESVEMALLGLIAPAAGGITGMAELRNIKNIKQGKILAQKFGSGLLENLEDLEPLQRTQIRAYYEDTLTEINRSGIQNLDSDDLTAISHLNDIATAPPPSAAIPNWPVKDGPRGPYIGLDERLGDDFQRALDSDWRPDPFYDGYAAERKLVAVEDGKLAIKPTNNRLVPDAEAISFDQKALGQGSFNTAFPIDNDWVARVPGGKGGRPDTNALKADKGGRTVFENTNINQDQVRLVKLDKRVKVDHATEILAEGSMEKSIRLNPGDEIEVVENFKNGSLKSNMAKRTSKRMTPEEAIAYDKGVRELNGNGLVALDLKPDNFGFEAVSPGSKELRLVILDPGGLVPIKSLNAETARRLQSAIDTGNNISPNAHPLLKKARIFEQFEDAIDVRALGLTEMSEIPFNPMGVSGFERGRDLASLSKAEADAYYITLRATGRNP